MSKRHAFVLIYCYRYVFGCEYTPNKFLNVENISLIGNIISELLQRDFRIDLEKTQKERHRERTKMGLIITHTGFILDYVTADKGQVLFDGVLTCTTQPREIFRCIRRVGYEECIKCAA